MSTNTLIVTPTVPRMRTGNVVIVVGVFVVLIGVAIRLGWLSWFGTLPGDLRIENENSTVFIPFTSMLLLSIGGSVVLNLVVRLFRD